MRRESPVQLLGLEACGGETGSSLLRGCPGTGETDLGIPPGALASRRLFQQGLAKAWGPEKGTALSSAFPQLVWEGRRLLQGNCRQGCARENLHVGGLNRNDQRIYVDATSKFFYGASGNR